MKNTFRFFSAVRKGDPAGTDAEKPRTLDNLTEISIISVLKIRGIKTAFLSGDDDFQHR
ncbi:MAG: hypothetical protein R2875_09765 [Desulfobacterales bacterium]